MKVILTEKPKVAEEIMHAIGGKKKEGYCECNGYVITWVIGHALEIDNSFMPAQWNEKNLPIFPQQFRYSIIQRSAKQYRVVKEVLKKASEIIIATDAEREGELIARLVLNDVNWKDWAKTKRFWVSGPLLKEVIIDGIKNAKPAAEFENMYYAALTRQHADWLTGINLTQLVTLKAADKSVWTVGRVQTPVLRLIVDRDHEIKIFKTNEYYVIKATFEKEGRSFEASFSFEALFKAILGQIKPDNTFADEDAPKEKESRLNKANALFLVNNLKNEKQGFVNEVIVEKKKNSPPLLHSITTLQQEANAVYGFSAQQTLDLAQMLYATHKVTSYPRTESHYLADENEALAKEILQELGHPDLIQRVSTAGKKVFDSKKLTDHHAIIPYKKAEGLNANEQKVYELIVRRFLGAFMEDYIYERTEIIIQLDNCLFSATGKTEKGLGWKALYKNETDEIKEAMLPLLSKGEALKKTEIKAEQKFTSPPPSLDEKSLLEKMLKYKLGTGATRAGIIERLITSTYVVKEKRHLKSTIKGQELISKLNESKVADPEFTAEWEGKLEDIYKAKQGAGYSGYTSFITEIKEFVRAEINQLKGKEIRGFNLATPKMIELAKKIAKENKLKLESTEFGYVKNFIDSHLKKELPAIGPCSCSKEIQQNQYSYFCACGKKLSKEVLKVKIPWEKAVDIFQGKEITFHGFKGKKGSFSAKLHFVGNEIKLLF